MMEGIGVGLAIGFLVLLFAIGAYIDRKKEKHGVQIEMIRARLILLSTDPKEIEEFLLNKEPYITKEMIEQLINRVSEIKAEQVINQDWAEKTRVAEEDVLTIQGRDPNVRSSSGSI